MTSRTPLVRFGATFGQQLGLLSGATPRLGRELSKLARQPLGPDAWYDYAPGWLGGDERLLEELTLATRWHREQRVMYERTVEVPRLYATLPQDGPVPEILKRARAPSTSGTKSVSSG